MTPLKPPMLIDAFRLAADTHEETINNIVGHYSSLPGGWNHQRCLRSIMLGFNGATDRAALISGCKGEGKPSQIDNAKIVEAVLPRVIGRLTQCFPYKRKSYPLTPTILCPMGPSFFIVEAGVIRLVYVHARNEKRASIENLAGLAALFKTALLDQDFYGQAADVELHLVDKRGDARRDHVHSLETLTPYLSEPPDVTLKRFATALVEVMDRDLVTPPKRQRNEKPAPADDQLKLQF